MSKEPIKKANGSLAVSNFEQDANMGMGNLTQDDLAIPEPEGADFDGMP